MLEDASTETSERVIAVLGSRLEAMTRLVVGLHLEPSIRGDRRVRSKVESAKCLDDVVSAVAPDSRVGADNPLDVAVLRAQVYAAETAQASAERELAKETFRRENAAVMTSSTTKELAETRHQHQIFRDIAARYQHDASALSAIVEQHKELYQRMENRVKAAEGSVQRLTSQLEREREIFKAAVAVNTAPSRRLHNLLSSSGAADVSTETHLRRRNEDLPKRVKRLIAANRTLRARIKLADLDPDTLVLVAEELDWGLLNLSDETRVVVRDALKTADASRSADEVADSVARAAFQVSALPSEMSPKAQAAETRRTSPGTSLAEVREATSKRKALSSSAARARKRFRGRLRVHDDDSDSESDSGGPSASSDTRTPERRKTAARPDSTPVASKSRSLLLSRSSSKGPSPPSKRSLPRSRRASTACSQATSRAVSRTSSPARGGVPASSSVDPCAEPLAPRLDSRCVLDLSRAALQSSSLAPPVTAASSGAPDASAAGGVSLSLLATSQQNALATLTSQPSHLALSCDESVATIMLSDGEAEVEDQSKSVEVTSSVSTARSEFRSALLLEALEADDDDILGLIDFSPVGSSAGAQDDAQVVGPAGALSRGVIGGQVRPSPTTPSRSSTGRRTKPTPRVVATLSSMPGADRGSQRLLPVPASTGGPPPIVRVSKQVAKWAQPFASPGFRRPGASKCWTRILNCRLLPPGSAKTRVLYTVATLEAFMDYTSPSHPWQRLRRHLPPQACLFDTTTFDPHCKVSQRAPAPLRVRGYWRAFRGFDSEADAAVGFALWERDHWIPARAVELYLEVAYRALKESFDEASRPFLQVSVDAVKERCMAYVRERTQRSDRLRQKLVCTLWEWCRSDRFPDVDIELMFEPSMPGFSLEPHA
ncbi:unnamed protein product [Phytophthora fragariaefolia]|uniref:Unnamed protein product n=1 Tax=Phytophthora fragariaefolia TaxID=1490495 RepID=A0A9W7CTX6_9STRA|nr:unnamed protein product [Phytophthora fragariaefolia]